MFCVLCKTTYCHIYLLPLSIDPIHHLHVSFLQACEAQQKQYNLKCSFATGVG